MQQLEDRSMATIQDLESRVEALEMHMPARRGIVACLHELDNKFQHIDDKFDAIFTHFKINFE